MIAYDKDKHVTCKEAAAILGISRTAVTNACTNGKIPAQRDATDYRTNRYIIDRKDLERHMKHRDERLVASQKIRGATLAITTQAMGILLRAKHDTGIPMSQLAEKAIEEAYGKYL